MRRTPLTTGWETRLRSSPFAELAGSAPPWLPVTLPHDAALGRPRGAEHSGANGFFPGGTYEYRTVLPAPPEWRDRHVLLEFEGVQRAAMIYVNGALAAQWPTGYTGFTVELDDFLHLGEDNTIRVECRSHADSRWYSGAGLHRPVHLLTGALTHVPPDGVTVSTRSLDAEMAVVEVATTVKQVGRGLATVTVAVELRDPDGAVVTRDRLPVSVRPGEPAVVRQRLTVPDPRPWSPDSPDRYTADVTVADDHAVVDDHTVVFGIRTVQVDPHRGLRINGQPVALRGACVHSDNGLLGAAAVARADQRRVQLLKDAGFNALRSAHNPMSRAMLDACDEAGMLVMDELTDVWTQTKTDFDAALDFPTWWRREVAAMVAKDANHPSVILYSIGNEVPELGNPHGASWSRRIAEEVRRLDPTRLVTNGVNGALVVPLELPPGFADAGINTVLSTMGEVMTQIAASDLVSDATEEAFGTLDVVGMNYMESRYEADRQRYPHRVIVGSETFPAQIDRLWRKVRDNTHVIGDFTWTGWDYLGEAGIGRTSDAASPDAAQLAAPYPWLTAWCGDLDITGHRRPISFYREIVYGLRSDPYLAVERPHRVGRESVGTPWSWTDALHSWTFPADVEGTALTVEVYSDAEEVELLLNGRSVGVAPAGEAHRFTARFTVPYSPGDLTAVARSAGQETGRCVVRSTGPATAVSVTADSPDIRADPQALVFLDLTLVDDGGAVVTCEDRELVVTVEGSGSLQAFGSAAPATEESFLDDTHTTFDGRALAIVRPTGPGQVTITATGAGCRPGSTTVRIR